MFLVDVSLLPLEPLKLALLHNLLVWAVHKYIEVVLEDLKALPLLLREQETKSEDERIRQDRHTPKSLSVTKMSPDLQVSIIVRENDWFADEIYSGIKRERISLSLKHASLTVAIAGHLFGSAVNDVVKVVFALEVGHAEQALLRGSRSLIT